MATCGKVASWLSSVRRWGTADWLAVLVNALGLALRVEHACTFDSVEHGADYLRHMEGVNWMMHHWRPFDFTPDISWTTSYQGPLWYAVGGVIKLIFQSDRALASIAVLGWVVRQFVLSRFMAHTIPRKKWATLIVLTFGAFLPISVETDGTINPETLHSTMFAVGAFWLWRMELEARRPTGIRTSTALIFGVSAGFAVLTKATSGTLPLAAALLVAWQTFDARARGESFRTTWQRLLRPNVLAGLAWCVVAGGWVGPNLLKYHHPFPHAWDLHPHMLDDIPEAQFPFLYRRPLGWALPFDWHPWLEEPLQQSYLVPRPNAWAQFITGTWADLINRGFCRLHGGGVTTKFFDGWPVSGRCVQVMSVLAHVGLFMSVVVVFFLLRNAVKSLRSARQEGTLALPLVAMLCFGFTFLFTLKYPVDGMVSTNARYILPISIPLMASLGIGLSDIRRNRLRCVALSLLGVIATLVAVLVTYERWG